MIRWEPVIERAAEIVRSYSTGVTLRQMFYRLVAEGALPNTHAHYKRLGQRTTPLRRAGTFPALVDRTRAIRQPSYYEDAADARFQLKQRFRVDRTEGQKLSVYIGGEKDTLSAEIENWFSQYGVPILIFRGNGSVSYEREIQHAIRTDPRSAVLLYVGDLDPVGMEIERQIVKHIPFEEVRRVALTIKQKEAMQLPENDDALPKLRRTTTGPRFIEQFGRLFQVEVEAIPPDVLQQLTLDAFHELWDGDAYAAALEREQQERAKL